MAKPLKPDYTRYYYTLTCPDVTVEDWCAQKVVSGSVAFPSNCKEPMQEGIFLNNSHDILK